MGRNKKQTRSTVVRIDLGDEVVSSYGLPIVDIIAKLNGYLEQVPVQYRHTAKYHFDKYEMYYEDNWETEAYITYET